MSIDDERTSAHLVSRVAETFVELVEVLVEDLDLVAFFERLTYRVGELISVRDIGLVVLGQDGEPAVAAATDPRCRDLEAWQAAGNEGPSTDSRRTWIQVVTHDLTATTRWPRFRDRAATAGYRGVNSFPLRRGHEVIGALTTYFSEEAPLDPGHVRLVQSLVDVATIALLQKRALRRSEEVSEHLQAALHSRVVIEQAKGAIAYLCQCSMDEAFARLRRYSRSQRVRLEEVARMVFDDASVLTSVMEHE